MDLLKELVKLIPEDHEAKAGLGPFVLQDWDPDTVWMEHIFRDYHDHYYEVGPSSRMRLSEIDTRIFKALAIAATLPELDWMDQCHRIKHICKYWPIMRSAGHYLYNRHEETK